jgi:hypothetical protein
MSGSRASRSGPSVARLLKMRSLGSIGFIAVLAFYVAWPAFSGYEIKSSLDGHNVEGLMARIDFPSVRASLKPAVAAKVDKVLTDALRKAGTAGGALVDQLKARIMPPIVDGVLATLVTPEMMIRIHASGKSLKEAVDGLVAERAAGSGSGGGLMIVSGDTSPGAQSRLEEIAGALGVDTGEALGGLVGKKEAETGETAVVPPLAAKGEGRGPKYGIGNIKHFSLTGPFGLSVGVARDAAARKPDVTADLTFVGGTWKLTALELAE